MVKGSIYYDNKGVCFKICPISIVERFTCKESLYNLVKGVRTHYPYLRVDIPEIEFEKIEDIEGVPVLVNITKLYIRSSVKLDSDYFTWSNLTSRTFKKLAQDLVYLPNVIKGVRKSLSQDLEDGLRKTLGDLATTLGFESFEGTKINLGGSLSGVDEMLQKAHLGGSEQEAEIAIRNESFEKYGNLENYLESSPLFSVIENMVKEEVVSYLELDYSIDFTGAGLDVVIRKIAVSLVNIMIINTDSYKRFWDRKTHILPTLDSALFSFLIYFKSHLVSKPDSKFDRFSYYLGVDEQDSDGQDELLEKAESLLDKYDRDFKLSSDWLELLGEGSVSSDILEGIEDSPSSSLIALATVLEFHYVKTHLKDFYFREACLFEMSWYLGLAEKVLNILAVLISGGGSKW